MQPLSLNKYLDANNSWTKRILGLEKFQKTRDINQVENEYNLDKYASLLKFDLPDMEAYKTKEFELAGLGPESILPLSVGDELFTSSIDFTRNLFYTLIRSKVRQYGSGAVCELGCGYGYNLTYLGKNAYGGEYAENAVKLAQKLGLDVVPFNYYNEGDYSFIKNDSTILTVHSIEQIPDASVIIENLSKHKDKINCVIHFEPSFVPSRTSLLGLFRNKYIELCDYNRNLSDVLHSRRDVEILEYKTDIFGLQPLNSSNLIVWKFK